jgi:hypothetical protein
MKPTIHKIVHYPSKVCALFVFLFTVLFLGTSSGQPAHGDSLSSPPTVEIAGTQSLHLTSSIVGQEFNLYVNIPRDYQDSSKAFPVIYLLDGAMGFSAAQCDLWPAVLRRFYSRSHRRRHRLGREES